MSDASVVLRDRVLAVVDARLDDRTLTPADIAMRLGVSRSTMYRLLRPYGGVGVLILLRRLNRAARVFLTDPESHGRLKQVAEAHGFASASHFSRAFLEAFDLPPRRYCVSVRDADPKWLAAQFARVGLRRS